MFAPVLVFCTRFERRYKVLARRAQDQDGDLTTLVEEAATGVRVLKALGRGPEAAQAHLAQAARLGGTRIGMARLLGGFWSTLDLVPNAVIALAVMLGAVAVGRHAMTIGGLVAFITLALQLVWPVEALGYVLASGEEAATAAQRVLEIFDALPAITSKSAERETGSERVRALAPPGTHPLPSRQATSRETVNDIVNSSRGGPERRHPERPAPGHGVAGEAQRAHVRFDRVSFAYPGSSRPVLREVTLDVAHGETLVITGATGSGKTTLLHLVPRLADVTGGRVLLGGTDVRDIPLPRLRAAVGCAFEEATLFSASVRENVTFGAAEATEEEIETALTAAQARFAYDLPWGLDTRIGEQGMALSGGQRQRVALARAILSRPEVLILDDPLSALDVATEERVTAALVGETGAGKTTVARLLARFYDPDAGRVLLDGVDLRSLPDAELRREIVLVTQESFLFEGTVAENIRLGRPSASDDEVEAAARAIGAHEFIASLPEGYATKVGKRGGKLSAGQRQLLSFCRAFIAAPSVLVLDEATALLDIPSERLVQSALHTVLAGRTALIIAHRLSTVAIADRVLVLRSGQVIEDGTPAELMGGTGEYADLHVRWAASLA
jgi:ABC-type multidrug transport system fused ATPase/permease subunit